VTGARGAIAAKAAAGEWPAKLDSHIAKHGGPSDAL
jgi:hypothetical protein